VQIGLVNTCQKLLGLDLLVGVDFTLFTFTANLALTGRWVLTTAKLAIVMASATAASY
jgi:Na+/H+ antiporter NhaA